MACVTVLHITMNDHPQTISFRRRNLPHWRVMDRPYFVTFRLKGSLPRLVTQSLREEYDAFLARNTNEDEVAELQWQHFRRLEAILDCAMDGPLWLRVPEIAQLVMNGLNWLERSRSWQVQAAVVMPNHVHCLIRIGEQAGEDLETNLGIMKSFIARQANAILKRTGKPFWTPENFDHWCRNAEKTDRVCNYIRMNPVEAGLVKKWQDWPWMK